MNRKITTLALLLATSLFGGSIFYVSPDGTPEGAGTEESPLDLTTAYSKMSYNANDELRFLPGVYKVSSHTMNLNKYPVKYIGMGQDRGDVVFDFEGQYEAKNQMCVGYASILCNVTISNFYSTARGAMVYVQGNACISNVTVCCGTSKGAAVSVLSNSSNNKSRVIDCEFRDITSADVYGAAMTISGTSETLVKESTFSGNSYTGWGGEGGGAIHMMSGGVVVDTCVFTNNISLGRGGAIYLEPAATKSILVTNSVFAANSAANLGGGGIFISSTTSITNKIIDCVFRANVIGDGKNLSGAGIYSTGINSIYIKGCEFYENVADIGAAITYSEGSEMELSDSIFESNSALDGGAVCLSNSYVPTVISNCVFKNNSAVNFAGAIFSRGPMTDQKTELYVYDSEFLNNSSKYGGAVGADYNVNSLYGFVGNFKGCKFKGNVAYSGGAVSMAAGCFEECDFISCSATNRTEGGPQGNTRGGAYISSYRATTVTHPDATNEVKFIGCNFTNCRSAGNYGSAVFCDKIDSVFSKCKFTGNRSEISRGECGGAITVNKTTPSIEVDSCSFVGNFTIGTGAALGIIDNGSTISTIRNSLFLCNSNTYHWGATAVCSSNTCIESCSFISNRCDQSESPAIKGQCAGVQMKSYENSSIVNCLFYDNRDSSWTSSKLNDVYPVGAHSIVSYCYSNYDDFDTELNNISAENPYLGEWVDGFYTLSRKSPCFNKGIELEWMSSARDIRDNKKISRILGGRVDIGCIEYLPKQGLVFFMR